MVQMTMDVSDELAERLQPIRLWLPTVLELSFVGFRTLATQTATEVVNFLLANPAPQEVLSYHVSKASQARLRQLLALRQAGILGEEQQRELDELEKVEHIVIMLKGQVAKQLRNDK